MKRADRLAQIAELRARGLSRVEMAEAMGISVHTLGHYLYDPDGARIRAYRKRNLARTRAWNREAQRRWKKNNPEHASAEQRKATAAWRRKNPEATRAHNVVRSALKGGRLARPERCEACSSDSALHAHHADYSKPLDVQWLCVPCHEEAHHGPAIPIPQEAECDTSFAAR